MPAGGDLHSGMGQNAKSKSPAASDTPKRPSLAPQCSAISPGGPQEYSPTAGLETRSTVQKSRPAPQRLADLLMHCTLVIATDGMKFERLGWSPRDERGPSKISQPPRI